MRSQRGGKKKLVVAFHFQFANQAGWNCDSCRKAGLEITRRCGWLPDAILTKPRTIWARRGVGTDVCPRSFVTAQSLTWIEEFLVWRELKIWSNTELTAKQVEAFFILQAELAAMRAETHTRDVKKHDTAPSGERRNSEWS